MASPSALIIDDEPVARELLRSVLRNNLNWYRIEVAHDGDSGAQKCAALKPSIVFIDIEMPGSSGFDTLQKILADNPQQYAVMVSAHSTLDNVKKSLQMGAKGFIVKPYTIAKVKDVTDKFLRQAPPAAGPAP
jgi:two-component system chemotaxis response regulator CheY